MRHIPLLHILFSLLLVAILSATPLPAHSQANLLREFKTGTSVNALFQDKQGVVWAGTDNGLFYTYGTELQKIPVADSSLAGGVTAVAEAANGVIWAGFRNGRVGYLRNGKLRLFNPEEGLPKQAVTAIIFDTTHSRNAAAEFPSFWFSTYGEGIYYYTGRRMYNINTDDGLIDNYIYTLAPGKNGAVWAASDQGVSTCRITSDLEKIIENITPDDGLPDNIVHALVQDNTGNIWAGMYDKGVCRIDGQTLEVTIPPAAEEWTYGPVISMLHIQKQNFLTATKGALYEVQVQTGEVNELDIFPGANITVQALLLDDEGNIWLGTRNAGILLISRQLRQITELAGQPLGNVQAVYAAENGHLWYSTASGLYEYFKQNGKVNNLLHLSTDSPEQSIISIFEDKKGRLWAGSFGNGVYIVQPDGEIMLLQEKHGLINNNVLSISGNEGEVWLGTLGGVSRVALNGDFSQPQKLQITNFNRSSGLSSNYIYDVFIDTKGRKWFATDGSGINLLENGTFTQFDEADGLRSDVVYSITEDDHGHIWFSTQNAGLYQFDGKRFTNFTQVNGLTSHNISSIMAGENGDIIVVHENGIDVVAHRHDVVYYLDREMGDQPIEPDLNAITKDRNGKVWIGTSHGLISYQQYAKDIRKKPQMLITSLEVFLNKTPLEPSLQLSHNKNHVSFEYVGLWYHDPASVVYQHKLEGFDLEWITSRDQRSIYPNLPPGDYVFKVRAAIDNNFAAADTAEFAFTISPPVWQRAWFIGLLILLLLGAIYGFIKIREKRIKRVQGLERDKLAFQFQTLKNQVNPHFLFNSFNTLLSIIETDQKVAAEYVERLSDFFRHILSYRDKEIIQVREELRLVQDYIFLQKQRYQQGLHVSIKVPEEVQNDFIPPLTLQLLIENAIKHNVISRSRPLEIEITVEGDFVVVTNNLQRKRKPETSTKVGLENISSRYRLLTNKEILILDDGKNFTIKVPIIKQAL